MVGIAQITVAEFSLCQSAFISDSHFKDGELKWKGTLFKEGTATVLEFSLKPIHSNGARAISPVNWPDPWTRMLGSLTMPCIHHKGL